MKKQFFVFVLFLSLVSGASASIVVPEERAVVTTDITVPATVEAEPGDKPEAIYCTVYNDQGYIAATCWFCDCGALWDRVNN